MLLWLGLCFAPAVLADIATQSPMTSKIQEKPFSCGNEDVLFKIWEILSNLLDTDGKTVKVPSRGQIQYALTLIKKSILDNTNNQNVDLLQKLFLSEAELAKYKGVLLNDNRSLRTLLDLDLITNDQNSNVIFKYELRNNISPSCRDAFMKLIQTSHKGYEKLAKRPDCSDDNVNAWLPNTNGPNVVPQSLYTNIYNPSNNAEIMKLSSNYDVKPATLFNPEYPRDLNTNLFPATSEVDTILGTPQKTADLDSKTMTMPQIVNFAYNRPFPTGNNLTMNLDYAKNVAEKITKLYQSKMLQKNQPFNTDLSPGQPFINPHDATSNLNTLTAYSSPLMQPSYVTQNGNLDLNHDNDNKLPLYNIHKTSSIESYSGTNIMPSQNPRQKIIEESYTNPQIFTNSKYHPKPSSYQNYVETYGTLQSDIPLKNSEYLMNQKNIIPPKISIYSSYYPSTIQNNVRDIPLNEAEILNKDKSKSFQNDYPYQPANTQNLNYYPTKPTPESFTLLPNYATGSNQYGFQQVNSQNNIPYAANILYPQNNVNPGDQQVIQSISAPQSEYKGNLNFKPHIQSYKYSSLSQVQNNVPEPLTQQAANHNNHQTVIDTLANWISGTNPVKLKPDIENDQTDIELTYLVKSPPPQAYQPTTYFVKFRLPYKAFAEHFMEFLNTKSNSRSGNDLYKDLAVRFNATLIPTDTSLIPKDVNSLEDNHLVRARLIEPSRKLSHEADNLNSVDIINLVARTALNNANVTTATSTT